MQSAFLCVKHKEITISHGFKYKFAAKVTTIVDVTGLQQHHHP